jgi:hypothetical protein
MTFLKEISGAVALGTAAVMGSGLLAPPAQAGYIVTLAQVGSNVVATGSGTINLADLSLFEFSTAGGQIEPSNAAIFIGPTNAAPVAVYGEIADPASFGSGLTTFASSGSGDAVGILGRTFEGSLTVPSGYTSGNPLSDTSTYDNATFSSLGATPGTYVWTWGSGANADSFTLEIGTAAAVPEPSSLALLGGGLGLLGLLSAGTFRRRSSG